MIQRNRQPISKKIYIWDKNRAIFSMVCVAILIFVMGMFAGKLVIITSGEYVHINKYHQDIMELDNKLTSLQDRTDKTITHYRTRIAQYQSSLEEAYEMVKSMNITMDEMNDKVDYYMDKYWFVWRDKGPNATIKYSELVFLDEVAKEVDANPFTALSVAKVESRWNSQANLDDKKGTEGYSTARGYFQIIIGTGEWRYKETTGSNDYNHDWQYDPLFNIDQGVRYMDYKIAEAGNDPMNGLKNYNGEHDDFTYSNKVKAYMKSIGQDIDYRYYVN